MKFIYMMMLAISAMAFAETPDEAMKKLMEGNQRFVDDKLELCLKPHDRRLALTTKQKPFAVIVGCSDSRVSPEIVFDQTIGDIFVIRVAGNVVGPLEQDSIDYSVLVNGSAVVVVLGHENCGAVKAVLENNTSSIKAVAALIAPAIANAKKESGNEVENAVKANVSSVKRQLQNSKVVAKAIQENKLKVVGAYYNLTTGKVNFL